MIVRGHGCYYHPFLHSGGDRGYKCGALRSCFHRRNSEREEREKDPGSWRDDDLKNALGLRVSRCWACSLQRPAGLYNRIKPRERRTV